jgi:ankyrin repeat protein
MPEITSNVQDDNGFTPLHLAAQQGHVGDVERLLQLKGPSQLALVDGAASTSVHLTSESGHSKEEMLSEPAANEVNINNNDGNTPLHLASEEGHDKVVQFLLENVRGLDMNGKNRDGNTPLHLAAVEGHVGVVNLLLKHASVDFQGRRDVQNHDTKPNLAGKNCDGNTALHLASEEGHEEVVRAILLSGCVNKSILNAINEDGNTPLHLAIKNGHANVVTKMLEDAPFEFDLNAKNKHGHTPLHFATRKCHLHVVKALCSMGQQLRANLEDGSGKTCLQYAKDQQDDNIKLEEIANILTERSDVKDFLDRQYRDRQVFIDAANALLVGGALIAGITFASWLQPPLGYITYYQFHQSSPGTPANTFEAFAGLEMHYSLRLFWVFNTLSFFFAIATVISGAKAAFPDLDTVFIVESLRSVRRELQWTAISLVCAVVTVLGSFVCAGFAILPPIQRDVRNMKISVIIGLVICGWTIFSFLMKLFRTMAKAIKQYKATSRNQQTKYENLWVWLLQSVKFMQKPRGDEDEEMEVAAATRLNTKTRSRLLGKTNKSSQCVEYIGDNGRSGDPGAIQGNGPARHPRRRYYYFEITIKDCGRFGRISIGFTGEDFNNYVHPGWGPNSYGYHSDNGHLYHGDDSYVYQLINPNFGPKFSTNDIVGAGIDHLKQKIFFHQKWRISGRFHTQGSERYMEILTLGQNLALMTL